MNFLHKNAWRKSPETPNLGPAVVQALIAASSTLDPVLIATQILELAVTHSKQTTATCSNRYFFGTFHAESRAFERNPRPQEAPSNRKSLQSTPPLAPTKQSIATVSNRQNMHGCVFANLAHSAPNFQPTVALRTPRA
jgi:hypothetical protein